MNYDVNTIGGDVVQFLESQHAHIKMLFEDVIAVTGSEREAVFHDLCALLEKHETCEETVVHPAASQAIDGGKAVAAARLKEETAAKRALAQLEGLDVDSEEFEIKLSNLRSDVIAHIQAEEQQELRELRASMDPERLVEMRAAIEADDSPEERRIATPGRASASHGR